MTVDNLKDVAFALQVEGERLNEDPGSVMAYASFEHEGFSRGGIGIEVSGEQIVWVVLWNGDTEIFSDDLAEFEKERANLGLADMSIRNLDWIVCFDKELLEGLDNPLVPKTEPIKLAIDLLKEEIDSYVNQERES